MFNGEGSPGAGRLSDDNLPDSIRTPLAVYHKKKVNIIINQKHLLTLLIAHRDLLKANPALTRALFVAAIFNDLVLFISDWYEKEASKNKKIKLYHVDSAEKAAEYICGRLYDDRTAEDLRIRFEYYLGIYRQNGLSAPADVSEYGEKMFLYFKDNSITGGEDGLYDRYSLPSVNGCPGVDAYTGRYEAVNKAFDMTREAFSIIVSNAVYTYLFDYLSSVCKRDVTKYTVKVLVGGAAENKDVKIAAEFVTTAETEKLKARIESGVSDMKMIEYIMNPRAGCNIVSRLLSAGAIIFTAKQYLAKNKKNIGKDTRSRKKLLKARCNIRKFHKEFIAAGKTGGELLHWTVVHLDETMGIAVPPYIVAHAEKMLKEMNALDTPLVSVLPSEWNQHNAGNNSSRESAQCDYISHFVVKLRRDILPASDDNDDKKDNKNKNKNKNKNTKKRKTI